MDGIRFVCPGVQFGLIPHEPLVVQKQAIPHTKTTKHSFYAKRLGPMVANSTVATG